MPHLDLWKAHPNTFIIRYEDMVQDTLSEVMKISSFLEFNLSEGSVRTIINKYEDDSYKERIHLAHGQIGRYKEVLSSEEIQKIHDTIGNDLVAMGYSI